MQKAILALAFFLLASLAFGQKYLQLERLHSAKTKKYQPGDEITFQLNNGQWYTRVIDDINYERQFILFANGHVAVDSIVAFRSFTPAKWSRPLGNQLINFSAVWLIYGLVAQTVDGDGYDAGVLLTVPVTSSTIGLALKKLFKHRTYRIHRNKAGEVTKWRLRTLDLTVK
ncbi:MAG: hypothetical protein IT258_11550 [Saprospiraceae bacterium]|nr:hypothetical protein [Saprospiraceae bacterium]